jgi:hypothetical protein
MLLAASRSAARPPVLKPVVEEQLVWLAVAADLQPDARDELRPTTEGLAEAQVSDAASGAAVAPSAAVAREVTSWPRTLQESAGLFRVRRGILLCQEWGHHRSSRLYQTVQEAAGPSLETEPNSQHPTNPSGPQPRLFPTPADVRRKRPTPRQWQHRGRTPAGLESSISARHPPLHKPTLCTAGCRPRSAPVPDQDLRSPFLSDRARLRAMHSEKPTPQRPASSQYTDRGGPRRGSGRLHPHYAASA